LGANAPIAWTAAQTWVRQALAPNIEVSAAIFANSGIPAQVLGRGSALNSSSPSFYALSIKQGIEAKIQRVQGGVTTTLALVSSKFYLSNQWVRATLNINGDTLLGQVVRLDTNQYLNSSGTWQTTPTWALTVHDGA